MNMMANPKNAEQHGDQHGNQHAERQSGQMRQICPTCNSRAKIRQSRPLSPLVTEYYIICLSPDCGGTWKAQMSIEYMLSPSAIYNPDVILPDPPPGVIRQTFPPRTRASKDSPDDGLQSSIFDIV